VQCILFEIFHLPNLSAGHPLRHPITHRSFYEAAIFDFTHVLLLPFDGVREETFLCAAEATDDDRCSLEVDPTSPLSYLRPIREQVEYCARALGEVTDLFTQVEELRGATECSSPDSTDTEGAVPSFAPDS
jgi:hypothetical protein